MREAKGRHIYVRKKQKMISEQIVFNTKVRLSVSTQL